MFGGEAEREEIQGCLRPHRVWGQPGLHANTRSQRHLYFRTGSSMTQKLPNAGWNPDVGHGISAGDPDVAAHRQSHP